ncbi:MAG: phosphatase PAP2 family protein [Caldilinea sp. CFX5]|nr:phosphatase PAP2 family protein [Caldilinea sp. CFX5]
MVNAQPMTKAQFAPGRQWAHSFSRRAFLTITSGLTTAALTAALTVTDTDKTTSAATPEPSASDDKSAKERRNRAYKIRQEAAQRQHKAPLAVHVTNGDEERYPTYFANYSKGLPHDHLGHVDQSAYATLLAALKGRQPWSAVPLGGSIKLTNPQAAFAFQLEGADSHSLVTPAPPAFASEEIAGEMTELYWLALTRDIPFAHYGQEALTVAALADLQQFSNFRTLQPTTLFRGTTGGDWMGPYISQFLYLDVPYGATTLVQRYRVPVAGDDYMTTPEAWLASQNGQPALRDNQLDTTLRYLTNQRDLGEWVHRDFSYQAYLHAALLLHSFGPAALDPANPYRSLATQNGFVTLGAPDIFSLVGTMACLALKAAWAQKWVFHRRLRPEAFGGRVYHHLQGNATYPLHPKLLTTKALATIQERFGNALLPLAYPEGAPTHPAYPSGHATIAGACVTLLKAFYAEEFLIPRPKIATADGLTLVDYKSAEALSVGGELNKLAANIALGRAAAGVHWRSDGIAGILLGEAVALAVLADLTATYTEHFDGITLTRFNGDKVVIGGGQASTAEGFAEDERAVDEYKVFLPTVSS